MKQLNRLTARNGMIASIPVPFLVSALTGKYELFGIYVFILAIAALVLSIDDWQVSPRNVPLWKVKAEIDTVYKGLGPDDAYIHTSSIQVVRSDDLWATAQHINVLYPIAIEDAKTLVLMIGTSGGAAVAAQAIGEGLPYPHVRAVLLQSGAKTTEEVRAAIQKAYPNYLHKRDT